MRVDHVCVKKFGAHQTFSPRFGWLKKAFDGVSKNPQIFSDDDAPRHLGVGKNMVDSIAFWATGLAVLLFAIFTESASAMKCFFVMLLF